MNIFLIILGLYILGYIIAYYSIKFINYLDCKRDKVEFEYDWEDVMYGGKISIGSWLVILMIIIVYPIVVFEEKYGKKIKNYFKTSKPPKWL
jgi:hypothetical protein